MNRCTFYLVLAVSILSLVSCSPGGLTESRAKAAATAWLDSQKLDGPFDINAAMRVGLPTAGRNLSFKVKDFGPLIQASPTLYSAKFDYTMNWEALRESDGSYIPPPARLTERFGGVATFQRAADGKWFMDPQGGGEQIEVK